MSSEINISEQMKPAIEETRDDSNEDAHYKEHITHNDAQVSEMYYQVNYCAHILSSSYKIICPNCISAGHFHFQCSQTYDESLVSYNNGDATSEILEFVLYKGSHELLRKVMVLMMSGHSEFLQMAYETLQYIVDHCQDHLSENALVIESKERRKSVVPKNNHLQESQDRGGTPRR